MHWLAECIDGSTLQIYGAPVNRKQETCGWWEDRQHHGEVVNRRSWHGKDVGASESAKLESRHFFNSSSSATEKQECQTFFRQCV